MLFVINRTPVVTMMVLEIKLNRPRTIKSTPTKHCRVPVARANQIDSQRMM